MENKLEQLLNSLIEKGWKPRWHNDFVSFDKVDVYHFLADRWDYYTWNYNIREFVSKESWLWQFVCENGMVGRWDWITKKKKVKDTDSWSWDEVIYYSVIWSYNETDYQYRVIESALCDEDKLEEFLLSNIKVDVGNRW